MTCSLHCLCGPIALDQGMTMCSLSFFKKKKKLCLWHNSLVHSCLPRAISNVFQDMQSFGTDGSRVMEKWRNNRHIEKLGSGGLCILVERFQHQPKNSAWLLHRVILTKMLGQLTLVGNLYTKAVSDCSRLRGGNWHWFCIWFYLKMDHLSIYVLGSGEGFDIPMALGHWDSWYNCVCVRMCTFTKNFIPTPQKWVI